jgi:methylase of polypeptide subunit release factors
MNLLVAYDRARAAIAEAKTVKATLEIRDQIEHVKLHAKKVQDRELLADAIDLQLRTERQLGEFLTSAKKAGHIREGRPAKSETTSETAPASLTDIGVDRKLSAASQRLAALTAVDFEATVTAARDRARSNKAIDVTGSRAIMASRLEADDSLDYFPTPPWATRALIELVLEPLSIETRDAVAWEPACGEGHIAEVLSEYFREVMATDIHDYGYGGHVADFLTCQQLAGIDCADAADWIITNPPFGDKSEAFVLQALDLAQIGVAMFVRLQWLETEGRYERIFSKSPPTLIAFFAERVNLCKGRWDPDGSTATAYIWLVWIKGKKPRAPFWIPPGCRETFARDGDVERFTQHPVAKRLQAGVPA